MANNPSTDPTGKSSPQKPSPQESSPQTGHEPGNEGEGSQTGARDYNDSTRKFIESGKVDAAARDAAKAVDGPEAEALRKAEQEGKRHSHGEDPALKRK